MHDICVPCLHILILIHSFGMSLIQRNRSICCASTTQQVTPFTKRTLACIDSISTYISNSNMNNQCSRSWMDFRCVNKQSYCVRKWYVYCVHTCMCYAKRFLLSGLKSNFETLSAGFVSFDDRHFQKAECVTIACSRAL